MSLAVDQPVFVSHVDTENQEDVRNLIRTIDRDEMPKRLSRYNFGNERNRTATSKFHSPNYKLL